MKGNIYHLLNRGVEKRKIFLSDVDYVRFAYNLKDFNTKEQTVEYARRRNLWEVRPPTSPQKKLVDVIVWTLLPNHPHIMVTEKDEGNVSAYSQKTFGGYTMYFNEKHDRNGVLFQGRTKIIQLKKDAHLLYLPFYIHLNILDLFQPGWKENGIKNPDKALEFMENYRWSNFRDIIGAGNGEFANATNIKLFYKMYSTNARRYKKDMKEWLHECSADKIDDFKNFE